MDKPIDPNLLEKIKKGIQKSGFPLELNIAKILKENEPSITLFVAPGYEWQRQQGRFMLFYGPEVWASYEYAKPGACVGIVGSPSSSCGYEKRQLINTGLSLFFGAKYFINHRFSVALESQLTGAYSQLKEEVANNNVIVSQHHSIDYQVSFSPIYQLNLGYHF